MSGDQRPAPGSPLKPLVVYDGGCGICAGNLKWLHRLDWLRRFDAMPYQSDEVYRLFPGLNRADCEKALQLAFPDGRVHSGPDAFREVFLRMPLTFLLGIVMAIPPMPWALRKLYPILARNRYHLGGRCKVMLPADAGENPTNPDATPEGIQCTKCKRDLGGYENRAAYICMEVMGDEHIHSYWLCEECGVYTKEIYFSEFLRPDDVWVRGPIPYEKGRATIEMIQQCPHPHDKRCDCDAHRRLSQMDLLSGAEYK